MAASFVVLEKESALRLGYREFPVAAYQLYIFE
jgi:hypothetical protein